MTKNIVTMKATIYHTPKCSKSRAALEYLTRYNVSLDVKLYMDKGITRSEIYDILTLVNCDIDNILRKEDVILIDKYCEGLMLSKEGIINAIIEHPILLQRPIILLKEKGIGAIARSEDTLIKLFKDAEVALKEFQTLQEKGEQKII